MKIKLTYPELLEVYEIIGQVFDQRVDAASRVAHTGDVFIPDLHQRLVAINLRVIKSQLQDSLDWPGKKPSIRFSPSTGLSLMSAWLETDMATLSMSPLGYALFNQIIETIMNTYCARVISAKYLKQDNQ